MRQQIYFILFLSACVNEPTKEPITNKQICSGTTDGFYCAVEKMNEALGCDWFKLHNATITSPNNRIGIIVMALGQGHAAQYDLYENPRTEFILVDKEIEDQTEIAIYMLHELGHVVGLKYNGDAHSQDPHSLMYFQIKKSEMTEEAFDKFKIDLQSQVSYLCTEL